LDGNGDTVVGDAGTGGTPYDNSGDYPVLDGAGNTIVATAGAAGAPYDFSGDYPVLDGNGDTVLETYFEEAGSQITTDDDVSAIDADGWRATVSGLTGTSTSTGDKVTAADDRYVVVQSAGFAEDGSAASLTRNLKLTHRIDEIYPSNNTFTASDVSLSEYVYSGDTVSGVLVNSTLAAPKPIPYWITKDREFAEGDSLTIRIAVIHAHARRGRPVACVEFSATDGTNTTATVRTSTPVDHTFTKTGRHVTIYQATVDTSALDDGVECTMNAVIKPWVGASFTASSDASTYPSPNFTVLKFVNGNRAAYGHAIAVVNTSTGNDGTGVASETQATADASPFATIGAALLAIQSYNNTNFSRNDTGGGEVQLAASQTHTQGAGLNSYGNSNATDAQIAYCEIRAVGAGSSLQQEDNTDRNFGMPKHLRFGDAAQNITVSRGAGNRCLWGYKNTVGASFEPSLIWENVTFDENSNGTASVFTRGSGRNYFYNCDGDLVGQSESTQFKLTACMYGCTGDIYGNRGVHHLIGNDFEDAPVSDQVLTPNSQENAIGRMFYGNRIHRSTGGLLLSIEYAINDRGFASCLNEWDYKGPDENNQIMAIGGTSTGNDMLNVVIQNDLLPEIERNNFMYCHGTSANAVKQVYVTGTTWYSYSIKGDVFLGEATHVGNQALMYGVSMQHNAIIEAQFGDPDFGTAGVAGSQPFTGDGLGLGTEYGLIGSALDPGYTDAANSDYQPGAGYNLGTVPGEFVPFLFDVRGASVPVDGTAKKGPIQ
jgi:hypothetical protein